jgi:hypothetical protein
MRPKISVPDNFHGATSIDFNLREHLYFPFLYAPSSRLLLNLRTTQTDLKTSISENSYNLSSA